MPYQVRLTPSCRLLTFAVRGIALLIAVACLLLTSPSIAQPPQGFRPGAGLDAIKNFGRSLQARAGFDAGGIESQNFVVYANDEQMARKVSQEAERFRKELAIEWLGHELPNWRHKCPITVKLANNAGGETSFAFITNNSGPGQPIDWNMKIFGPPDRLLDAVLPHEVTHTIFATHFGRPLPRWADEGACTTVEHEIEREKNHRMLLEFLTSQPSRGIPFNHMFTMRNYPHDILPLYAQGYSVARFLIAKRGRRHFVDYIGRGLQNEGRAHVLRAWDGATQEFYQYKDLSELQIEWLAWVKNGSDVSQLAQSDRSDQLANLNAENRGSVYQRSPIQDRGVVTASFVELGPKAARAEEGWAARTTEKPESSNKETQTAALGGTVSGQSFSKVSPDLDAMARGDSSDQSSWYIQEMKRKNGESENQNSSSFASAYNSRVASKPGQITSRLQKVPSENASSDDASPWEHDSRLPQWRQPPATLWR